MIFEWIIFIFCSQLKLEKEDKSRQEQDKLEISNGKEWYVLKLTLNLSKKVIFNCKIGVVICW